jgi:hypothetical protein
MVHTVQCTNCQSAVAGVSSACPVCGTAPAPARRIITGTTAPPAATPRRRQLVAAPAPSAAAPPPPPRAAPTTPAAAGPAVTAPGTPTAPGSRGRTRGLGVSLTGHVASTVAFDQREIGSGATYVLALLTLLALLVAGTLLLLKVVMVLLFPLVALILIISVVVNRAAGFDALKSILSLGVGTAGRAAPSRPGRPGTQTLDVARFRIVDRGGVPYDCEILGELRAPPPRLNDDVEVDGRRRRDGVVQVRRLRNRVSGTSLRGHVPVSVSATQAAPWVLLVLVVAAVLAAGNKY